MILRTQSCKRNHKTWDRCPLYLGGKFGKPNQVFVNNSFGIIAWFCCPNSLGRISPGKIGQGNPYQKLRGNKTEQFGQQS